MHIIALISPILLNDHQFINEYTNIYQARLKEALGHIKSELPKLKFVDPEGGFFALLDLQDYQEEKTKEGEIKLFNKLMDELKINLNPGHSMGFESPGFFRLCYAPKAQERSEFIKRMKNFL